MDLFHEIDQDTKDLSHMLSAERRRHPNQGGDGHSLEAYEISMKYHSISLSHIIRHTSEDYDGSALRRLQCPLSPAELDGVLRCFDADGSGAIDFSDGACEELERERELL